MDNDAFSIQKSKPAERLKHSLTYGNLWIYVLSLINEQGDVYAYTLSESIEKDFLFRPNRIML